MDVHTSLGTTAPWSREVRARLVRLGYLPKGAGGFKFDAETDRAVRAFQQERRISVDGTVGPVTFRHLEEARWTLGDRVLWFSAAQPHTGDDVEDLQRRLADLGFNIGRVDGIFGFSTDAALREFQRNVGMKADGTCGVNTVVALRRLMRTVKGGVPERLWDEHVHAANRTGITDKVIVLDPGHGGPDPGVEGRGLSEAVIAEDLARRVEGRLAAIGTQVLVTRPPPVASSSATSRRRSGRVWPKRLTPISSSPSTPMPAPAVTNTGSPPTTTETRATTRNSDGASRSWCSQRSSPAPISWTVIAIRRPGTCCA